MDIQYQIASWVLFIVAAFPFLFVIVTHYVTFDFFGKDPEGQKKH